MIVQLIYQVANKRKDWASNWWGQRSWTSEQGLGWVRVRGWQL